MFTFEDPMFQVKDSEKKAFDKFWERNSYIAGSYDKKKDFEALEKHLQSIKKGASRLFYLALPPSVYETVTSNVQANCMTKR